MAALDGDGQGVHAAFIGVELGHSAVEARLAVGHQALGLGLHTGQLLVVPRQGHGVDHHRRGADPHPERASGDTAGDHHLTAGR